jgi:outer membrane protein assembly factor BamB
MEFVNALCRALVGAACVASLAACGGGGSGGSAPAATAAVPSAPADGSWLSLTLSSPTLTTYEGEDASATITVKMNRTLDPRSFYTSDTLDILAPYPNFSGSGDSFSAKIYIDRDTKPGVYNTNFQMRACEDNAAICTKPLPGSPWTVPLRVEVKARAAGAARITWAPAAVELTTIEGEDASFEIVGQETGELPKSGYIFGVTGGGALLSSQSSYYTLNGGRFSVPLRTSSALAPGVYETTLKMNLCFDDVVTCARPVAGSPWPVAFKLTVQPAGTLSPLQVLPLQGAWSGKGGNAAHNSYVAARLDPQKFARRWTFQRDYSVQFATAPALDNGVAFVVKKEVSTGYHIVEAISEATGKRLWSANLGVAHGVSEPGVANGNVYVTTANFENFLWVYSQATGELVKKLYLGNNYIGSMTMPSPALHGGAIFLNVGHADGLRKIAGTAYDEGWTYNAIASLNEMLAVENDYAYFLSYSGLNRVKVADGSYASRIPAPHMIDIWDTPMLSGRNTLGGVSMAYVKEFNGRLTAFNLDLGTTAFTLESGVAHAAVGNGVLYVVDANVLEARAAVSGVSLWKSGPLSVGDDVGPFSAVIVSENLAFVRSARNTLAISLATREVIWSLPFAGAMSVSNRGVLHIVDNAGKWIAINLQ